MRLTAVQAGDLAALCTASGALLRPVGGALADRIGGIRALYYFYIAAGAALIVAALGARCCALNVVALACASAALGMANGSVFQLLPQRFGKDIGVMTGLVGASGGIGGFYLASSLGYSKGSSPAPTSPGCSIFSRSSASSPRSASAWSRPAGARLGARSPAPASEVCL